MKPFLPRYNLFFSETKTGKFDFMYFYGHIFSILYRPKVFLLIIIMYCLYFFFSSCEAVENCSDI